MNSKHKKTLKAVFAKPVSATIPWQDIENMLIATGARRTEGDGSRVKFDLNGHTLALHRRHKPKIAKAYQVSLVREFLELNGVKP